MTTRHTVRRLPHALALAPLLAPALAHAIFIKPDLVDVPVKRLIENLEQRIEMNPRDAAAHHSLARTHAMAFAAGLAPGADVKVLEDKLGEGAEPWFGHVPAHVPYAQRLDRRQQGDDPEAEEDKRAPQHPPHALEHLASAIEHYRRTVELKPDHTIARLGLAWCQQQAGDTDAAIAGYRKVIDQAWETEGKKDLGGLENFVVAEAVGYLVPLLDDEQHAAEIAALNKKKEKLESLPRPITPIAIPLADGLSPDAMIDPAARVAFDLDGTARPAQRWQWIRPQAAAWLVHDPRATGRVTSSLQMFGNRSFNLFFEHGYEALALLDDDSDGTLRGAELAGLALWQDHGADGISAPGEVRPLAAHGILALSCTAAAVPGTPHWHSAGGVEFDDGTRRDSFDLVLAPADAKN